MLTCISKHGTEDPEQGKLLAALALGAVKHLGAATPFVDEDVRMGGGGRASAISRCWRSLPMGNHRSGSIATTWSRRKISATAREPSSIRRACCSHCDMCTTRSRRTSSCCCLTSRACGSARLQPRCWASFLAASRICSRSCAPPVERREYRYADVTERRRRGLSECGEVVARSIRACTHKSRLVAAT